MGDEALLAQSVLTGKYTILREIGRGGMATVYLADDLRHRRQVAVKVLHPSLSDIGSDRFTREIGIVAQLQHPHIVPLYDSGESNGHLFYVMPFVEGETLSQRIERTGALPIREATRIAGDIAAALEYAHARGVIHRDIKPSNVLITADTAVVADFGIARVLTDTSSGALTKTGVVGTPTYMSPEHAEGTTAVGASSDIYALGCVLYEMLTGKPPYAANTFGEMIVKHVAAPVPSVRDARPEVSDHLDAIVQSALAKRVEERWASARELREALEQELADTPTERSLLTPRRTTARAVKARRRRNAFVSVASIVVASGLALSLWRFRSAALGGAGGTPLNASLVAVAPFDAVGANLELWRDGMVDVLSRNLDGAGPLRTVPPTTIIRAWRRQGDTLRADKVSGATLASRTGAGLVLLGQVVQNGPDSVKVTAQLYDAVNDSVLLADETFKDGEDNVDRLCDSVTVVVLQYLEYKPATGGTPGRRIGAGSVQALKAFLQGEQAYRRNDTATARVAYEKAIAEDSGFTLAYRRMRSVTRWDEWDSTSLAWALRAGERNHGLSRRDSLLVLSDSLAPSTRPGQPGGFPALALENLTRRLAVLSEAAKLYPDDPEVWNDIGEMRVHSGSRIRGNSRELTLQAFENAIALDSLFLSAYFHAIELSAELRGANVARKYALTNLALDPRASDRRLVARLLEGRVRDGELRALADTMAPITVRNAAYLLRLWSDPEESSSRVLRYLLAREDSLHLPSDVTRNLLLLALARRGHLREALSLTTATQSGGTAFFTDVAFAGTIPATVAESAFASWASGENLDRAIYTLPWWSDHGDTARISAIQTRCATPARAAATAASIVAAACDSAARGHLALVRGDTVQAARLFAGLPESMCTGPCDRSRLLGARLLLARGNAPSAAELLERHQPGTGNGDLFEGSWHLERARAAQMTGDISRAKAEYAKIERVWARADSSLKPFVEEARKARRN